MKRLVFILICAAFLSFQLALESCTPHKWFIVNSEGSEGILTYDRNKGTFELLWQNKAAGHSADSGSVVVDSIMIRH